MYNVDVSPIKVTKGRSLRAKYRSQNNRYCNAVRRVELEIRPIDKIYIADLNGDHKDEILIVNDNNMGVLVLSEDEVFEYPH